MKNGKTLYPFTIPGTVIFTLVLYLFGYGYASSDYQSIFISAVFFTALVIITCVCWYFSSKNYLGKVIFKSSGTVTTSSSDINTQSIIFDAKPPLFFRYKTFIKGQFEVSGKSFRYRRSFASDREGRIEFSFNFNSPGLLKLNVSYYLEDIFGFTRIKCYPQDNKTIHAVPGIPELCFMDKKDPLISLEKNKKPDDNDYEKILMREYVSGDRSRDINWKASSKGNALYTKISPGNDTQIKKINIIYLSDPSVFDNNLYRGFLVYRYLREYFKYFIYNLFTSGNYKFNIFINGLKISAVDRSGLERAVRELSLPDIKNNFGNTITEEEGSFIVFSENPAVTEGINRILSSSSSVRFFYPEIVYNQDKSIGELSENSFSGFGIKDAFFTTPGKGLNPGLRYHKDMRDFFLLKGRNAEYGIRDKNVRYVKIITGDNGK